MFHSSCRRQISLYDIRNPVVWQEKVFPPPGRVEEKPGEYVPGTAGDDDIAAAVANPHAAGRAGAPD